MNKNCLEQASCSSCANRTSDVPHICTWNNAELTSGLADDPECEGFAPKVLRTSKGKKRAAASSTVTPLKGDVDRDLKPRQFRKTGCPKTFVNLTTNTDTATLPSLEKVPDKDQIQTALKLKGFKGSVVMEKVLCGKPGCRCHSGSLHGPYSYLHYYSNGKVRRRYLNKNMNALLSHSTGELEKMLHENRSSLRTRNRKAQ